MKVNYAGVGGEVFRRCRLVLVGLLFCVVRDINLKPQRDVPRLQWNITTSSFVPADTAGSILSAVMPLGRNVFLKRTTVLGGFRYEGCSR